MGKRKGKRRGGRLHNLSYQRAFPPVAKGRGKGAKHLLSRGIKDGHFKEMHGFPCVEHTPWRRKIKAFWCTAAHRTRDISSLQKALVWLASLLKVVTQNQDSNGVCVLLLMLSAMVHLTSRRDPDAGHVNQSVLYCSKLYAIYPQLSLLP